MANNNQGWHGDSEGHARAGSQSSGNQNASQNLSNEDRSKGGKAAHQQGTAHEFTSDEARKAGEQGGSE